MDTVYVTDGSFEGLLSAVYDTWHHREDNVTNILPAQPGFLLTYQTTATDEYVFRLGFKQFRQAC